MQVSAGSGGEEVEARRGHLGLSGRLRMRWARFARSLQLLTGLYIVPALALEALTLSCSEVKLGADQAFW